MGTDAAAMFEAATPAERSRMIEHHAGRELYKLQTWRMIIGLVGSVPASAFVYLSIVAVAGETTTIDVSLVATFALTGVAGLAWKVRLQRQELKRLRDRNTQLEAENVHLKSEAISPSAASSSKEEG